MFWALSAVLTLWSGAALAAPGSLGPGDPAPRLEVKEFVKGEAVKSFQPGKTYVVEFWVPHLTELQKKNRKSRSSARTFGSGTSRR